MNIRTRELVSAATILILVAFGYHLTGFIDLSFSSELERFTGPRAYPRMILAVMLVLSLLLLIRAYIFAPAMADEDATDTAGRGKVALAVLSIALFVAVFEWIGFIVCMPVLLFSIGMLHGARYPARVAVTALIAAAVCLVVFRYGLNTVLPEGLLGIDQIF